MHFSRFTMIGALALCLRAQDAAADRGFAHFYNLEYDQAMAEFEKDIAQNPQSPDSHNHVAQTIVFREMYRNGALESELVSGSNPFLRRGNLNVSPADHERFHSEIQTAMQLARDRL